MNRCKTCRYWIEYGDCDCEKFVYNKVASSDGLSYWDAEGHSAGFQTGPDFGCVHWKGKDD